MNMRARKAVTGALAFSIALSASMIAGVNPVYAQPAPQMDDSQNAPAATQQELDQMLAPIALYPDSLLTQILMASTYPLEVVQAARWSRSNPSLKGDAAVRAVDNQNWDPSVKSLVAFPQVLELMDNTLDWTERLGNAFLSQESQVWDTVQGLRQRANAAGNLRSNDQMLVQQEGPTYIIEQARPDIVYVPYYDPLVVYGDWWWPGYAPVRWSPWSGYYARSGYGRGYYYGSGIYVGSGFFFGGIDWRVRHVNVINYNSFYYRNINRRPSNGRWQHDPDHRRGVPYRNPVLREQFTRGPGSPDSRRDYRGRTPGNNNNPPRVEPQGNRTDRGERGDRGNFTQRDRPQQGQQPGQPQQNVPGTIPGVNPAAQQGFLQENRGDRKYQGVQGGGARPRVEQAPQAFEGVGNGQDARNASNRGQASYPGRQIHVPQAGQPAVQPSAPRYQQPQVQQAAPQMQQRVQPPVQIQQSAPQVQRAAPQVQQAPQVQPQPQQQQAPAQHNGGGARQQRGEQR